MKKIFLQYKGLGSIIAGAIMAHRGKKKEKEGKKLLAESDKLIPDDTDQEQRFALNRIQSKRDSLYSGSYASTLLDDLNQNYANMTEGALSLASGGGADVTALLRQGKTASQAFNQTIGALEQQGFSYEQEAQRQLENIIQRKLEIGLLKHQEKRYDANSMIAAGDAQRNAGIAAASAGVDDMINTAISVVTGGMVKHKNNEASGGRRESAAGNQGASGGRRESAVGNISSEESDSGIMSGAMDGFSSILNF